MQMGRAGTSVLRPLILSLSKDEGTHNTAYSAASRASIFFGCRMKPPLWRAQSSA
jgi:hypothetical protein